MDIYCVVTGENEQGKSVFVSKTPIKPVSLALLPGYEFHRLWGSDATPELPSDGTPPPQPRYFPPKNGFRFGFFTIPPETTSVEKIAIASALEEIQQKLPGMIEVLEPDNPGMHTTDTVDFALQTETHMRNVSFGDFVHASTRTCQRAGVFLA